MEERFTYQRPGLARDLCDALEGKGLLDASSGLFLAAPRRTGKTYFLTGDMIPECLSRGWEVVYVDLWTDPETDPADLIRRSVLHALERHQSMISKIAKEAGGAKLELFRAISLEIGGKGGDEERRPLVELLDALYQLCQRPMVLIIDEAQQATLSERGNNTLKALKSARDQLNNAGAEMRLYLVCTGSSRDKLTILVLSRQQAFYGGTVTSFPVLDKGFAEALTEWTNRRLHKANRFAVDDVWEAFQRLEYRPELLRHALRDAVFEEGHLPPSEGLAHQVSKILAMRRERLATELKSLTPLARVVLSLMMQDATGTSPYTQAFRRKCAEKLGVEKVSSSSVQRSMETLRERGFVWRSERSLYRLEESVRETVQEVIE